MPLRLVSAGYGMDLTHDSHTLPHACDHQRCFYAVAPAIPHRATRMMQKILISIIGPLLFSLFNHIPTVYSPYLTCLM